MNLSTVMRLVEDYGCRKLDSLLFLLKYRLICEICVESTIIDISYCKLRYLLNIINMVKVSDKR